MKGPRNGTQGTYAGGQGGTALGPRNGTWDDDEHGWFGYTSPNFLCAQSLQSNNLGLGVPDTVNYPGINNPNASIKLRRRGSLAGNPPNWITEGDPNVISMQPRTVFLGASYPIGTNGCEIYSAAQLNAVDSGKWNFFQHGIDGMGLEQDWVNPNYPAGQRQLLQQHVDEIKRMVVATNSRLELILPIGGEHDSSASPDFLDWQNNLNDFINTLRAAFGPAYAVIPCLSWDSQAGGSVQNIITQTQEYRLLGYRAATFDTSLLVLRGDNVHYADTGGYGPLGDKIASTYFNLRNNVVPANPTWTATSPVAIASSAQNCGPVYIPVHQVNDVHLLILSGLGNTNYAAPAGWTEITASPQHNAGNSLNARLQVFWHRAVDNATPQPTIADLGGDDSKIACVINIRGANPSVPPFDVQAGTTAVTSTAISWPGVTTTVANTLVLNIAAVRIDLATSQFATWTPGTGLTGFEEVLDYESTSGAGFGIGVGAGVKATAGAVGATTGTLNTTSDQALITLAIKP